MKKFLRNFSLMLLTVPLFAQVPAKEKQALLDLYVATQGEQWIKSWDTNTPVNEWQGVTVENDHVVSLSLLFNNVQGTIPASIADLEMLRTLELSFNKITGSLPESIGDLSLLEVLAFNGNKLTGTIPASIAKLSKLKQLHLSSNALTGSIPEKIGNLTELEIFNVFDNKLEGNIPSGLAANRNLKELMVAENRLTSTADFSAVLLTNSGSKLNLKETLLNPPAQSVIAIETPDDGN
ncbi:Two component regulator three Y domain protein [Altibacter sp.]|uniref:leucine-rich repeat domain-containing protein n=1 Tax=Altibacter sp. TaxID=2024823 RepID=UPI0025876C84|nr:Two component regulator three Y domain protein [Altibacter sp.]MCW8982332.1 Two component regulator three Y domain protein [Altibacter sp.]MCW9038653.1 Two component regulator three Y domain protein [Altibacter sp.]